MRHEVVQFPSGTMTTAHSTRTASTMLAGSVWTSWLSRSAPPVSPMNGATIEIPRIDVRIRPVATGASRMIPQVRYQGWTTGPRTTKASRVMPSGRRQPERSRWRRQ